MTNVSNGSENPQSVLWNVLDIAESMKPPTLKRQLSTADIPNTWEGIYNFSDIVGSDWNLRDVVWKTSVRRERSPKAIHGRRTGNCEKKASYHWRNPRETFMLKTVKLLLEEACKAKTGQKSLSNTTIQRRSLEMSWNVKEQEIFIQMISWKRSCFVASWTLQPQV